MRIENPTILKHISKELERASHFFLISYGGLSVKKLEQLRTELRSKNAMLQVHKNALIRKACEGKAYSKLAGLKLTGGTALVWGAGAGNEVAKTIKEFAKANESVSFKGGFFEGEVVDGKAALQIADLPTKDEARAMLLRTLKEPAAKLVRALQARADKLNEIAQ